MKTLVGSKTILPGFLAAALAAAFFSGCNKTETASRITGEDRESLKQAAAVAGAASGLDFPSNGGGDVRFKFTGANLPPMYPATYVWRVNLRQQAGYYSVFNWGPDGSFTGANYYGTDPYPQGEPKNTSTSHKWGLSLDGGNYTSDAGGANTSLGYGTWKIQALRVHNSGDRKVHEFYWDLPDTTKVIRTLAWPSYGSNPGASALTFGSSPWYPNSKNTAGILRGIQVYNAKLATADLVNEVNAPLSTPAGAAGIWYLNTDPTPTDISDKSGKNHHPAWVGAGRPALWTDGSGGTPAPTVSLSANPASVASGGSSTLTWSSANATSCAASGAWSGTKALSGSQSTGSLSSSATYTLTCTGAGGSAAQSVTVAVTANPAPTVNFSASPTSLASGGSSTLTWSTSNATSCNASGAWSGTKATSGSQSTGALTASSTYTLACAGSGGTTTKSVTVTVNAAPAPTVSLSANPSSIESGQSSTLTWSSANATSCNASGAWSGTKATSGSQSTGALSSTSTYTLTCTGSGGSASQSATINVSAGPGGGITGLDFPSNGGATNDVRFRFKGTALQQMYPATYIWKVRLRPQCGYYTTFFWGPDGAFTGTGYYGFHPYPDSPPSGCSHKWEVSVNGNDYVNDANGHSTQLGYDTWMTQAARVYASGSHKVHEFFWNLPDTTKVIRSIVYDNYVPPSNPALTFGTAPWAPATEHLSGILRGIQTYTSALSGANILSEASAPLSTSAGSGSIWYLNLNPTPSDISDKSGKGHHPEWVTSLRPALWTGP